VTEPLALVVDRLDTPVGELVVVSDGEGRLRAVEWSDHGDRLSAALRRAGGPPGFATRPGDGRGAGVGALRAYFAGALAAIEDLPVEAAGTPFQRAVWRTLREIPCGATISYGELARRIGRPGAVRAVGLANGANPVGVVVPCHRVIGADGSLTGYGGGLERKRWLLAHEGAARGPGDPAPLPLFA
jgi:methylated-DNA-[protein]-cysteine S-methyltransferase